MAKDRCGGCLCKTCKNKNTEKCFSESCKDCINEWVAITTYCPKYKGERFK